MFHSFIVLVITISFTLTHSRSAGLLLPVPDGGPRKTCNKKMEYSPTPNRGSCFALLLITILLVENFLGFHPQVGSITLLLPERVLLTPLAKIGIIFETTKNYEK